MCVCSIVNKLLPVLFLAWRNKLSEIMEKPLESLWHVAGISFPPGFENRATRNVSPHIFSPFAECKVGLGKILILNYILNNSTKCKHLKYSPIK